MILPRRRAGLGQGSVAVVVVRQVHRQERVHPASGDHHHRVDQQALGVRPGQCARREHGDRRRRLDQQPTAVAPLAVGPPPQPRQEDRAVAGRADQRQFGRVSLGVVGVREEAVVAGVRGAVGVPALEEHQAHREQRPVGGASRKAECLVHSVVGDRDDRDEDPEDDHRGEPPPARPRRGREAQHAGERTGERDPPLPAGGDKQIRPEVRQDGRSRGSGERMRTGRGHRPNPRSRSIPSATMRLPSTQATVPRPGQVESPTSQRPRPPRSCGMAR